MPRLVRPHPQIADLNDRAFRAGVNIPDILRRAAVAQSTWMRWRRGSAPTHDALDRCNAALAQIIKEDEAYGPESEPR